jgi:hypothetical protein
LVSNSCLEVDIPQGIGSATFKISGTMNVVVQFEASADPLTVPLASAHWVAFSMNPSDGTTAATSATESGSNLSVAWQQNVGAYKRIRMRVSTYTSGTVAGAINLSTASARSGGGGGGSGSIVSCTTTGGVLYENGTNNTGTCDASLTYTVADTFISLTGGTGGGSIIGAPSLVQIANTSDDGSGSAIAWNWGLTNTNAAAGAGLGISANPDGSEALSGSTNGTTLSEIKFNGNSLQLQVGTSPNLGSLLLSSHSGNGAVSTAVYDSASTLGTFNGFLLNPNLNDGGGTVHNSYGYNAGDQHGVGDTRNAAFFAPDQGTGANDYAMYLAGGKAFVAGQFIANGTSSNPELETYSSPAFGVNVWDAMHIGGAPNFNGPGSCDGSFMLCLVPDISPGTDKATLESFSPVATNPDFLDFRDMSSNVVQQSFVFGIPRFRFTRLGILAFGSGTSAYPGLEPMGTSVVATLGDNSATAPLMASNLVAADSSSLAAQSLNEPTFATHAKWSVTGGWDASFTGNKADFSSAGGSGNLSQTSGNMAIAGVANAWYNFCYTVTSFSASTGATSSMAITTAFALASVNLPILQNGTLCVDFQAAVSPGTFTIAVTVGANPISFSFTSVSLQQITGGKVTAINSVTAASLALTGSAPAITATGTTPYINASGPLEQRAQCSFALTTSTFTLALSPVNLCTFTLPNAAVVWRVNCQAGWSNPAGTTPTFAVGNNWAQTPSGVAAGANIGTTNAGVAVEGYTAATTNSNIVATGTLTNSATIFPVTWWTTFTGSATSGAYHPTASLTGTNATGTLVGFCTIQ